MASQTKERKLTRSGFRNGSVSLLAKYLDMVLLDVQVNRNGMPAENA